MSVRLFFNKNVCWPIFVVDPLRSLQLPRLNET